MKREVLMNDAKENHGSTRVSEDFENVEEEEEVEVEEARPAIVARDPGCPTEMERKAHEINHLPFRIWCAECVKGRKDNPAHRSVPEGTRDVPEVLMDYAFMNQDGEDKTLTILVTKDRDTRVIMANVVQVKGRGLGESVDQGVANIKRLGNRKKMLMKVDNEPALVDLKNGIVEKLDAEVINESPPKSESESNGSIENAVKLVKGMIRVYKLALDRRIEGTLPTAHPIMAWLVEHAAENITKLMVGKDGKTGYERLFGKPCREEGIEFGESLWFRRRKNESKDLEGRWLEGIWLGRKWGTIDHLVFMNGAVHEARAVQRRPGDERWSRSEVEKVNVWPWARQPKLDDIEDPMVIPPKTEEEKRKMHRRPIKEKDENAPKSFYIQRDDLERFGYTAGCRRCVLTREGKSAHGIRHTAVCRERIVGRLRDEGSARIKNHDVKVDEYIAERMEASVSKEPPEGGGVPEWVGKSGGSSEPLIYTENEPNINVNIENESVSVTKNPEENKADEMDLNLMDLLQNIESDKNSEKKVERLLMSMMKGNKENERDAKRIVRNLQSLGISKKEAYATVWEFYSPPRVTKLARDEPDLKVTGERSFDLHRDPDGRVWNFEKASDRARARRMVNEEKPFVTVGSPPCTDWCRLNININHPKMPPEEVKRRLIAAKLHLNFCIQIYKEQLKGGRHFVHEHPSSAASWYDDDFKKLRGDKRVYETIGHMCRYGMVIDGKLVRKSTRWMSSSKCILRRLGRRCGGDHDHTKLEGGRPAKAAIYPPELCREILKGTAEQWTKDGHDKEEEEHREDENIMNSLFSLNRENKEEFWDDVNGEKLPAEETKNARRDEIEFMKEWDVWDIVDISEAKQKTGRPPIGGRWVDHNKGDKDSPNIRSRYVAQELALWKDASLFAAMPPLEALRVLLSKVAAGPTSGAKERKLLLIDVRKAYLHAEVGRNIFVQLPKEMNLPGKCARLKRCLYGTRDAASRWEKLYSDILVGAGFMKGVSSPCCFYHPVWDARCVVHGDDFTFEGDDEALDNIVEFMTQAFECKIEGRLGLGKNDKREVRVLNRVMRRSAEGATWEADPRHAEALIRDMGVEDEKELSSPGLKHENVEEEQEDREELCGDELKTYRSGAARANYLAADRPDIAYASKECCRHMAAPNRCHWRALVRIARYLKGKPRIVSEFKREPHESLRGGVIFSDTDFAGCRVTRKSTSGGCILLNGHLVKHWSCTQKVIALSSGEAELAGVVKAAGEALGMRSLCRDLGMDLSLHVFADSTAAIGICERSGVGRVRHIDVAQLWVQQKLKWKEFRLSKCLGTDNPADVLTKHVARVLLDGLLPRIGVKVEAGRAASAPHLV